MVYVNNWISRFPSKKTENVDDYFLFQSNKY